VCRSRAGRHGLVYSSWPQQGIRIDTSSAGVAMLTGCYFAARSAAGSPGLVLDGTVKTLSRFITAFPRTLPQPPRFTRALPVSYGLHSVDGPFSSGPPGGAFLRVTKRRPSWPSMTKTKTAAPTLTPARSHPWRAPVARPPEAARSCSPKFSGTR
jgi:hypothetical protein